MIASNFITHPVRYEKVGSSHCYCKYVNTAPYGFPGNKQKLKLNIPLKYEILNCLKFPSQQYITCMCNLIKEVKFRNEKVAYKK